MRYDSNDVILKVQDFLSKKDFCEKGDEEAYEDLKLAFNSVEESDEGFPLDRLVSVLLKRGWAMMNAKGYKTIEDALKIYIKCQQKALQERIEILDKII